MAINLEGEFRVAKPRADVYHFLTNPDRFAPLLPDFESLEKGDPAHFTVKAKVGVAHIRGTANIHLHLEEARPPMTAVYRGQGSVPGGTVNLTARFDLEEADGGTRVAWKGNAQLFGRLISVAGGLLEPLAKKNLQKLIEGLRTALA